MTTLSEFIANRRAEIKEAQAELKRELKELSLAEKAVAGASPTVQALVRPRKIRNRTARGGPTMREMTLKALEQNPKGMQNSEMIDYFSSQFGKQVKSASLSPLLSRMKNAGDIQMDDEFVWILVKEPSDESEGSKAEAGEGWNQHGIPNPQPAGSIPVSSTPDSDIDAMPGFSGEHRTLPGM